MGRHGEVVDALVPWVVGRKDRAARQDGPAGGPGGGEHDGRQAGQRGQDDHGGGAPAARGHQEMTNMPPGREANTASWTSPM